MMKHVDLLNQDLRGSELGTELRMPHGRRAYCGRTLANKVLIDRTVEL